MAQPTQDWKLHFAIENEVPSPPDRIGYAQLQRAVEVGQRGRVKRAVSTLVALDVLQWQGQRAGRAVAQGSRTLTQALDDGLQPMPEREIQTYPLLAGALDDFVTGWHQRRGDPIDIADGLTSSGDGVTTYCTSSLRLTDSHGSSTLTPFDLIVIVDLQYPNLGSWHEAHAVEVKPCWSVTRAALFKAADQAALRRCTFSWLLRSDEPNPAAPCLVHEMLDDPLIRKPHLRGFQHGFGPHCTSFPPGSTPSVSDDASCTDFPTVPVAIQELRN